MHKEPPVSASQTEELLLISFHSTDYLNIVLLYCTILYNTETLRRQKLKSEANKNNSLLHKRKRCLTCGCCNLSRKDPLSNKLFRGREKMREREQAKPFTGCQVQVFSWLTFFSAVKALSQFQMKAAASFEWAVPFLNSLLASCLSEFDI